MKAVRMKPRPTDKVLTDNILIIILRVRGF